MKVSLHTRTQGLYNWRNLVCEFTRLPVAGEYLALGTDASWHKVQLVVHTPDADDGDGEVYAVEINPEEAKRQAFYGRGGN